MSQYDRLYIFTVDTLVQLAPALLLLALLSIVWLNPRTARRFQAALIDVGVAGFFIMIGWMIVVTFNVRYAGPFPGAVLGTIYIVFRDAMLTDMTQRRSVGKKLMRLRLYSRNHRRTYVGVTLLRNLLLISVALVGINRTWAKVVINVVVISEALLICFTPRSMRIGDYLANTRVAQRVRGGRAAKGTGISKSVPTPEGFGELK